MKSALLPPLTRVEFSFRRVSPCDRHRSRVREPPCHRHYHLFRDGSGDSGGHRIHPGALCGVSADPGISEIQSPPLPEGPVTNRKSAGKSFTSSQQRFPLQNRRECGRRTAEEQTHFCRTELSCRHTFSSSPVRKGMTLSEHSFRVVGNSNYSFFPGSGVTGYFPIRTGKFT